MNSIMNMENILTFKDRNELRTWFLNISDQFPFCWLYVSIKPKENTLLYLDVVEEAICFGWIDSVKVSYKEGVFLQRISPRRKKSHWTELNKERARRLIKLGYMTKKGYETLPDLDSTYLLDEVILNRLEEAKVLNTFKSFPILYQIIRMDSIIQVKEQKLLFEKRIHKLISETKLGKMYGSWNDFGRLIDY